MNKYYLTLLFLKIVLIASAQEKCKYLKDFLSEIQFENAVSYSQLERYMGVGQTKFDSTSKKIILERNQGATDFGLNAKVMFPKFEVWIDQSNIYKISHTKKSIELLDFKRGFKFANKKLDFFTLFTSGTEDFDLMLSTVETISEELFEDRVEYYLEYDGEQSNVDKIYLKYILPRNDFSKFTLETGFHLGENSQIQIIEFSDIEKSGNKINFSLDELHLYDQNVNSNFEKDISKASIQIGSKIALDSLKIYGNDSFFETKNKKLILLDFWYIACIPCLNAGKYLTKFHKKYNGKGLELIGVNTYKKDRPNIDSFIRNNSIEYKISFDDEKKLANQLGINSYPTFIFLNEEGEVLKSVVGFSKEGMREIEGFIKDYLIGK
jgi:thiol-disulfide isomerase/thioredoxin